jgi:hypothetical protein
MGMPCGKYLVVMLGLWLPLLAEAGDLDKPFATGQALAELEAMSAATVDRYLKPARDRMRIKGISTTKPSALLRNSISIRTCANETPDRPGVIEADTVAHCGPTLIGEFARTLTMTDVVIGWTENCSIRNNASKSIVAGVEQLTELFPFDMVIFDSDCGSEFINHEVAAWLQARDIEQTGHVRTRKTTRPMWSRRTTMWCVSMRSIGATTPSRSWSCSTGCGGWCRCD